MTPALIPGQKVSISSLRRDHGIAYGDAARMLTQLERDGKVSPMKLDGSRVVIDRRMRAAVN